MNSAQQEIQNAPRAGEYPVFPEWSPETAGFGGSAELPVIPLIEPTILPAHVPYLMCVPDLFIFLIHTCLLGISIFILMFEHWNAIFFLYVIVQA